MSGEKRGRYLPSKTRWDIAWFVLMIAAALALKAAGQTYAPLRSLSSLLYVGIMLAWILTVNRRVPLDYLRRELIGAAGLIALLFLLRVLRMEIFAGVPDVLLVLRRLFFAVITAAALRLFLAGVYGSWEERRPSDWRFVLWGLWLGLSAACMFCPEEALFTIGPRLDKPGAVGCLALAWVLLTLAGAFAVIGRRHDSRSYKRNWRLCMIPAVAGYVMLIADLLGLGRLLPGGSRSFLAEFCGLLFIGTVEVMLQTDLLPSNVEYEMIFRNSGYPAQMRDLAGRPVLQTAAGGEIPARLPVSEDAGPTYIDADHRVFARRVTGGTIIWEENISEIRRLTHELEDVLEVAGEERQLLEQDRRIREATAGYRAQNEIYVRISRAIYPQLVRLEEELGREIPEDLAERRRMFRRILLLGVQVKRKSNLMLSTQDGLVASEELCISIREAFRVMQRFGVNCELYERGRAGIPAGLALAAEDLLEEMLERGEEKMKNLLISLECEGEAFHMRLECDDPGATPESGWRAEELAEAGAELSVREEDGLLYVRLNKKGDAI